MPLPANHVVADALSPMAPPAPEDDGRCQSKYLRNTKMGIFLQNVKDSKYWKDHKEDPVFFLPLDENKIIPVEEALSQVKQRRELGDELNAKSRSQSRSVSVRQDSVDMLSSLESLERALRDAKEKQAELIRNRQKARALQGSPPNSATPDKSTHQKIKVKEEQDTPPQSATSEKQAKSAQHTEDVLAALGVTGVPKPVVDSAQGSPNEMPIMRSRSPSKADM